MTTTPLRIEAAIRDHMAPTLREDGFIGSGRTFRRMAGDWIHVVSVQGARHGGQFAVNLALQPLAIPDVRGVIPDPRKITAELCEFRRRMSESRSRQDKWWKHDSTIESMVSAVREATATYLQFGRSVLQSATAEGADLNTISPEALSAGKFDFMGFGSTECRMALALARLRKTKGRLTESRAFAEHALKTAGSASLLTAEVRAHLQGLES